MYVKSAIPRVEAADFTYIVPLKARSNVAPFWINSQKPAVVRTAPRMMVFNTGTDYLRAMRSEEHTSELQSRLHLVCRLLLEKKKTVTISIDSLRTAADIVN